ncbi:hypothetical protein QVD17_11376 [Tagetes erecta]|uniref:Senescence regulator n=1 Tax=Tagetes erecta TaxID=13708 RepID=A0AAD8KU65_TARER|nr:hypothetical protein QVD17_11376 [Tagetes erecta]
MATSNFRYLTGELQTPISPDSMFELDESDIWNNVTTSPDFRNPIHTSLISNNSSSPASKRGLIGGTASSLPVNVPDWSKILKQDFRRNRNIGSDFDDFDYGAAEDDSSSAVVKVPPHEYVAKTRIASFSVHEGIGRTLKGRDLSRVRNAIWEKIGFED